MRLRLDTFKVQRQWSHWKLSLIEGRESVMCEMLPATYGKMLI